MTTLAHQQQILNLRNNLQGKHPHTTPAYQSIAASNIQVGEGDVIATCDAKIGGVLVRQVVVRREHADNVVEFPAAVELTSPALGDAVRGAVLAAVAEAMP